MRSKQHSRSAGLLCRTASSLQQPKRRGSRYSSRPTRTSNTSRTSRLARSILLLSTTSWPRIQLELSDVVAHARSGCNRLDIKPQETCRTWKLLGSPRQMRANKSVTTDVRDRVCASRTSTRLIACRRFRCSYASCVPVRQLLDSRQLAPHQVDVVAQRIKLVGIRQRHVDAADPGFQRIQFLRQLRRVRAPAPASRSRSRAAGRTSGTRASGCGTRTAAARCGTAAAGWR